MMVIYKRVKIEIINGGMNYSYCFVDGFVGLAGLNQHPLLVGSD